MAGDGAVFNRCVAADNSGEISGGFEFGAACSLTACIARNNTGNGFSSVFQAAGSTLDTCTASGNSSIGFRAEDDSTLKGCLATGNGFGFALAPGSRASDCTASSNSSDGFALTSHTVLSGCVARSNGRYGFTANALQSAPTLKGCVASLNEDHGFFIDCDGFDISDCTASGNIGNGFRIGSLTGRGRLYSCHVFDDNYILGNPGSNFYGPVEQVSNALLGNNPYVNTLW